jgi:nucleotide-binding universal stress UspA family protein
VMQRPDIESGQILVCYDGSEQAERAVDAAAVLLGRRHAVVLTVAPAMTFAEGIAATSSVVPGGAFEEPKLAEARRCAEAGAARGLSGLREVAHGSVSHDVATHVRRPVLIVPPSTKGAV